MSTPDRSVGIAADRPAERGLFRALFDDAAVFPPGLATLPQAISDHVARASSSYADLIGPLLLPTSAIKDFLHLQRPRQVEVALIGGPGADLTLVADARSRIEPARQRGDTSRSTSQEPVTGHRTALEMP